MAFKRSTKCNSQNKELGRNALAPKVHFGGGSRGCLVVVYTAAKYLTETGVNWTVLSTGLSCPTDTRSIPHLRDQCNRQWEETCHLRVYQRRTRHPNCGRGARTTEEPVHQSDQQGLHPWIEAGNPKMEWPHFTWPTSPCSHQLHSHWRPSLQQDHKEIRRAIQHGPSHRHILHKVIQVHAPGERLRQFNLRRSNWWFYNWQHIWAPQEWSTGPSPSSNATQNQTKHGKKAKYGSIAISKPLQAKQKRLALNKATKLTCASKLNYPGSRPEKS